MNYISAVVSQSNESQIQSDPSSNDIDTCHTAKVCSGNIDMPMAFVVGVPRSGTTLLVSILSRHSAVAVPPETSFFQRTYDRRFLFSLSNFFGRDRRGAMVDFLFTNSRFLDLGLSKTSVLEKFGKYPVAYKFLFRSFLQVFAKMQGKNRIIEKTPIHLEYVDTILSWYPDAKIVHIIRDGRDVSASLMQVAWTHKNLDHHAAYWAWCVRTARKLEHKYPKNFYTVKFEELISAPKKTIRSVCEFLGLEFEASMLDTGVKVATVPEWEREWKDASLSKPNSSKLAKWKTMDQRVVANIEQLISTELQEYNYPLAQVQTGRDSFLLSLARRIVWHRRVFCALYGFSKIRRYIVPGSFYSRERQLSGKVAK